MTIAFLGTGSMGRALLSGILAGGTDPSDVIATARSRASAEALAADLGVRGASLQEDAGTNRAAVAGARFVFLGVKPWQIVEAIEEITDAAPADAVIVSMAAGVSLAQLAGAAGGRPVVRIMPNTPAQIGHGVIALVPGESVPAEAADELAHMLAGAGDVVRMPEEDIHAMTAIAGSGAAYFYHLAEALAAAGVELGLSPETATRLVVGTANGAGRMLEQDPRPAHLRAAVTSKGGTTAAALESFAEAGFTDIVARAAAAADARSRQMESER